MCTNISCSLRGADALYEAMLDAAGDDPEFHVKSFECLGACDIAPMASVDGEYVGPLERTTAAQIVEDVKAGRPVLEAKQLRHRDGRRDRAILMQLLFDDIDQPGLNTLDVYRRERGGYEMLGKALEMEPGRRARPAPGLRPARPRRRRLRHGHQGVVPAQGRHGQVRRLQRGRVRAGRRSRTAS